MKEASGELNMTLVTIIAVAAIGAIFALVSTKTGDCIFPLFENVLKKYLKPDFASKNIIENKRKSDITKIRNSAENRKINKKSKCKC